MRAYFSCPLLLSLTLAVLAMLGFTPAPGHGICIADSVTSITFNPAEPQPGESFSVIVTGVHSPDVTVLEDLFVDDEIRITLRCNCLFVCTPPEPFSIESQTFSLPAGIYSISVFGSRGSTAPPILLAQSQVEIGGLLEIPTLSVLGLAALALLLAVCGLVVLKLQCRRLVLAILWCAISPSWHQAVAQSGPPAREALIILLAPGPPAPTAEEVVTGVNSDGVVPGDLPIGNPDRADFALSHRATSAVRTWLDSHPEMPLAQLHRYIVLEYPEQTDLDTIEMDLSNHPHVLYVERDKPFVFSSTFTSDPLLNAGGVPGNYQWGHWALNLPAAWSLARGHGYVGLIDSGVQVDHPDLRPYHTQVVNNQLEYVWDGGNFRPNLSWDFGDDDADVDELHPGSTGISPSAAGHGTHVAGLVAATTDNGIGVAGSCWHCSLMIGKVTGRFFSFGRDVADALTWLTDRGSQVVSMSLGEEDSSCFQFRLICAALEHARQRGLTILASAGNDRTDIDFPASDSRVISVGGIEADGSFWDNSPNCPTPDLDFECGSNYTATTGSAMQGLVAPATSVLSTFYTGKEWNPIGKCGDSYHTAPGYGLCTGTSMASPYVAGIAGIVRSVNPWLDGDDVKDLLFTTADGDGVWHYQRGYGLPDAAAAVQRGLGFVGGKPLTNRVTALFSLYSDLSSCHLYTSVPQVAAGAVFDCQAPFVPVGPAVASYAHFPGIGDQPCQISPCPEATPRASVYLFTNDKPPYPGAPALVPLYRMSYDPDYATRCRAGFPQPPVAQRGFIYTTDELALPAFRETGYELDGIEGYVFPRCSPDPQCRPAGTARLYRLYHPGRDDYAIFPETELSAKLADGYVSSLPALQDWIGFVYTHADADGDGLIDGWEALLGTSPIVADSDCDGLSDGAELLAYYPGVGYRDPLAGPCAEGTPLFADGFESGNVSAWSGSSSSV